MVAGMVAVMNKGLKAQCFIQSQHCLQAESVEVFVAELIALGCGQHCLRVVESLEGFAATNCMEEVWKRHCHELE